MSPGPHGITRSTLHNEKLQSTNDGNLQFHTAHASINAQQTSRIIRSTNPATQTATQLEQHRTSTEQENLS